MRGGDHGPGFGLARVGFSDLPGWGDDDHAGALAAFRRGAAVLAMHPPKLRRLGIDPEALAAAIRRAAAPPGDISGDAARRFFEDGFIPHEVRPDQGAPFFTGYYEPIVAGSRSAAAAFPVPLYAPPDDLVEIDPDDPPPGIAAGTRFALRTSDGFAPRPDRAAIEVGSAWRSLPRARLRRRSGRCLLHPHRGRGAHPACRGRRDAPDLCSEERPPLHRDRPRPRRDGRAAPRAARPCGPSAPGSRQIRPRRRR